LRHGEKKRSARCFARGVLWVKNQGRILLGITLEGEKTGKGRKKLGGEGGGKAGNFGAKILVFAKDGRGQSRVGALGRELVGVPWKRREKKKQ